MIKVITLKQPWASLIACGYKEYEFRSWNTKYRGTIYIHAGKGVDRKAMERFENLNLDYPTSKIIAKANLVDTIKLDDKIIKEIIASNELVYGMNKNKIGYAWKLNNIERVNIDKHVDGKLSIWNYEL
jgi:hypothetical protein